MPDGVISVTPMSLGCLRTGPRAPPFPDLPSVPRKDPHEDPRARLRKRRPRSGVPGQGPRLGGRGHHDPRVPGGRDRAGGRQGPRRRSATTPRPSRPRPRGLRRDPGVGLPAPHAVGDRSRTARSPTATCSWPRARALRPPATGWSSCRPSRCTATACRARATSSTRTRRGRRATSRRPSTTPWPRTRCSANPGGTVLRLADIYGHPRDIDFTCTREARPRAHGRSASRSPRDGLLHRVHVEDVARGLLYVLENDLIGAYNSCPTCAPRRPTARPSTASPTPRACRAWSSAASCAPRPSRCPSAKIRGSRLRLRAPRRPAALTTPGREAAGYPAAKTAGRLAAVGASPLGLSRRAPVASGGPGT